MAGPGLRVAMFVFNPCTRDPRVHREAAALSAAGHEVRVYAFLEPGLPEVERRGGYQIHRADQRSRWQRLWDDRLLGWRRGVRSRPSSAPGPLEGSAPLPPALMARLQRAAEAQRGEGQGCPPPSPRALAERASPEVRSHLAYISRINRVWAGQAAAWGPQVCHAHDADTLEAAVWTARRCGARVVYDAHELWTEQHHLASLEEVEHWRALEARLIPLASAVITVNPSIAAELERRYDLQGVETLYNCPPLEAPPEGRRGRLRARAGGRPVALFQGGYMVERGLEELVVSASLQDRVAIALRGFGELEPVLRALAAEGSGQVLFLEPVSPEEMVLGSAEADVGVIPYLPTCLNNYLCTPNKLFEYMGAGVAVAGADVPELRRFIDGEGLGVLFDPRSPASIAAGLASLAEPEGREACAARARAAAERTYCWDKEQHKLLDLYERIGAGLS